MNKRSCPFVDDAAQLSGDDSGDETVLVSLSDLWSSSSGVGRRGRLLSCRGQV